MKITITTLLLCISVTCFSQEQEYELITLDGKEAYISTKTGEIRYSSPNSSINKSTSETSALTYNSLTNESKTHTIEKGETLYRLSKKYGISISKICTLNSINQNTPLKIGQKIQISRTNFSKIDQQNSTQQLDLDKTHTVKKGETLYSISRKYNLSVDALKQLNNINSTTLSIGQQLIIK